MALPKAHRLRHRRDFSAVYQAGLRRSTANLTLRALRVNPPSQLQPTLQPTLPVVVPASGLELPEIQPVVQQNGSTASQVGAASLGLGHSATSELPTRIGISISQKVSKRAVVRNRIKRQLKAILRLLLPQISPGWQLVIVVKSSATQCGYEQFLQELKQLLRSAEVIDGY